ncbi:hypothetical protein CSH63_17895 [Micromonospora tulbaghiae]|uniref:DUF4355 domain-containing protein n=1 Tax=Micromonospora tulbaghiae TaxID=479978 RepID=A0A386WMN3_9ACTN|nr:hypothetical protein [Micromonospora tulbaghiae]AYF29303.1 hypothetical protein CSH63_17895 [Micromonospora tulbaghiae]
MTQHAPVHPFTGLTAIGFRRNGDPIWPVRGGSGEGEGGTGGTGGGNEGGQGQEGEGGEQKPEIDWKAKAREWERKSKANADAAKRLAEIEEANKTEAEKVAERLAKAEQTAREAEAKTLRREVALEHHLSGDDAALLDAITDEAAMRRLAERLAKGADDRRRRNNHVPREGSNQHSGKPSTDMREFARNLFGRAD